MTMAKKDAVAKSLSMRAVLGMIGCCLNVVNGREVALDWK